MNEALWLYAFTRLDALGALFAIASVVLTFAVLAALIPSKNDAIFIVAGTGVIEAVKSEHVQRVAGKAAAVAEKALDDYLGEKEK